MLQIPKSECNFQQLTSYLRNTGASPSITSSPTRGVFAPPTQKPASPIPSIQRQRVRRNSTQSLLQESLRNRSSPGIGNGRHKDAADLGSAVERQEAETVSRVAGQRDALGITQVDNMDDIEAGERDHAWKDNKETRQLKREETEPAEGEEAFGSRPTPSMLQMTQFSQPQARSRGGSRSSKPPTPLDGTMPDDTSQATSRSRNMRNGNGGAASPSIAATLGISRAKSPRRSHKRGNGSVSQQNGSATGGLSPQTALSRPTSASFRDGQEQASIDGAVPETQSRSRQRTRDAHIVVADAADVTDEEQEEVEDDEEEEEEEPVYCHCGSISYGDMVACDGPSCSKEWFHLDCVGLTKPPSSSAKWYCSDSCRKMAKAMAENGR